DAEGTGVVAPDRHLDPGVMGHLPPGRERAREHLRVLSHVHLRTFALGPPQQLEQPGQRVGTDDHVDPRRSRLDLAPVLLREAASHHDAQARVALLERAEVAEVAVQAVVRILPNRACVEDHDLGLGRVVGRAVAIGLQQTRNPLRVVLVHLAPEGAKQVPALHRPPRVAHHLVPRPMWLFGVLHGPRLSDHRDLDLPGILQLLLHLLRDVPGHDLGLEVVDLPRLDHDADLAPGLHRVRLFHAGVARADLLQALESLDVGFQALPAGAGAATGDSVGDLREHGLDRPLLVLPVVRLDAVDDLRGLLQSPGDLGPDDRVGPLDFVRDGLADVVQERPALRDLRVDAELGGERPRDVGRLNQVLEHVLAVRRAVLEAPQQPDHLRVHVGDPDGHHGLLARPADLLLDLPLRALVHLLDTGGVDPAVG